jgi:hypothetical protein
MGVYVQRSLQGRIRDARIYMVETVSSECKEDCLNATGLPKDSPHIGMQYEPYYSQYNAIVTRSSSDVKTHMGTGIGGTGVFGAQVNSQNQSDANSTQLPPAAAEDRSKVLGVGP